MHGFQYPGRKCRGVQETAHHSNGWQTLYYRLPSHLPDFSHLTLRSIEVTAVAPAVPSASPAALTPLEPCLGYVGRHQHPGNLCLFCEREL